jgi:asparagine synthase (glutamine-hydrolysing)
VVARDHLGCAPLYYYLDDRVFAFATDRKAILALNLAPMKLNETYIGLRLVGSKGSEEDTSLMQIRRLPAAHTLEVTPRAQRQSRYWQFEVADELTLARPEDYADAVVHALGQAVASRIRTPGPEPISILLSGGLDSGAVAATAAGLLGTRRLLLHGLTSVPLFDPDPFLEPGQRGDERDGAIATATMAGINWHPITGESLSPLDAMRHGLRILGDIGISGGALHWYLDAHRVAATIGGRVLLTGAFGNLGLSWAGRAESIRSWSTPLRQAARRSLPARTRRAIRRAHQGRRWPGEYPVNLDFARRIKLRTAAFDETADPAQAGRLRSIGLQGRTHAATAEIAAAYGLEVRDPSADVRLLSLMLSIPERYSFNPQLGLRRWLIRDAMRNKLPESVRLERTHGAQGADLALRLRSCASDVEATITALATSPAADYLDLVKLTAAWGMAKENDSRAALLAARTVCSGLFAGMGIASRFGAW